MSRIYLARQEQVFPYVIPVLAGGSQSALSTALNGLAQSFFVFDPAYFAVPAGTQLQMRMVAQFGSTTDGDVVGVALYDFSTAAYVIAEQTGVSPAPPNNLFLIASEWQTAPTGVRRCQVRGRNQTAARGSASAVRMEFQVVPVVS